jgi:nucleoside-diphosphate-sugar epimerase
MKKILLVGSNGYIGSRLYDFLKEKYQFSIIDSNIKKADKKFNPFIALDYRNLDEKFLSQFEVCVWLAGHSSVSMSIQDPTGCLENNLIGLINFSKIYKGQLIYASSGSVYSNASNELFSEESSINYVPSNMYDFTKITFDNYLMLMKNTNNIKMKNFVGIRFGTVVGASKNIRKELLLNKMIFDGLKTKQINLSNPTVLRPVLFIEDLIRAIEKIIENEKDYNSEIYNLCSLNLTMEAYAKAVSSMLKVPINRLPNIKTYNFGMSNEKFKNKYNFEFTKDLTVIIKNIKNKYLE